MATRTVSNVVISGTDVTLTLSSPVVGDDTVTIAYTKPGTNPLEDTDGNEVISFPARSVVNNTPSVPVPTGIVVAFISTVLGIFDLNLIWQSTIDISQGSNVIDYLTYDETVTSISWRTSGSGHRPRVGFTNDSTALYDAIEDTHSVYIVWGNNVEESPLSAGGRSGSNWNLRHPDIRPSSLSQGTEFGLIVADSGQAESLLLAYFDNDLRASALQVAVAPTASIAAIASANEGETISGRNATISGGTYDTIHYQWSVSHGTISTPNGTNFGIWQLPMVTSATVATVALVITVRGTGTNARAGTSDVTSQITRSITILNVNTDTIAPMFSTAIVDDASLTITMDEALSSSHVPAASAFNVQTDVSTDTQSPTFVSASINGGILEISFSESLDTNNVPVIGAFDVQVDTSAATLSSVSISSTIVTLTLATPTTLNQAVTVAYTKPGANPLQDAAGNEVATFSAQSVTNSSLPAALAPSVTIDNIPNGASGSNVTLGATIGSGGTYDGTVTYAWSVPAGGGTFDDATSATPVWTRPSVSTSRNVTVTCQITARGTGTNARNGTSDTASDTEVTRVLVAASAPSVVINTIASGTGGTTVTLGATLSGGTYDGAVEYSWSIPANSGSLSSATSATPVWTRPSTATSTNVTVSLTITVRGSGTNARNGTSDTASDTEVGAVTDSVAPAYASSAVDGTSLTITFNETLDTGSVPATSTFNVQVAGSRRTASNVAIAAGVVTLTLASAVTSGQTVTVAYTKPSTNPLQDSAGNDVPTFGAQSVTNNTATPVPTGIVVAFISTVGTFDLNLIWQSTIDISQGSNVIDYLTYDETVASISWRTSGSGHRPRVRFTNDSTALYDAIEDTHSVYIVWGNNVEESPLSAGGRSGSNWNLRHPDIRPSSLSQGTEFGLIIADSGQAESLLLAYFDNDLGE